MQCHQTTNEDLPTAHRAPSGYEGRGRTGSGTRWSIRPLSGFGVDRLLSLAAAPIFAIMALVTAIQQSGMPDMLCSASQSGWPVTGMVPMYLLMAAFHAPQWLKLVNGPQSDVERRGPTL